jgi:hypothetical protein
MQITGFQLQTEQFILAFDQAQVINFKNGIIMICKRLNIDIFAYSHMLLIL